MSCKGYPHLSEGLGGVWVCNKKERNIIENHNEKPYWCPLSPLNRQVGGNHYKNFAIQPVEFIQKNKLGFCEGNVIKYICRHKNKGGIEDLKKAKHYIELLAKLEYGEEI